MCNCNDSPKRQPCNYTEPTSSPPAVSLVPGCLVILFMLCDTFLWLGVRSVVLCVVFFFLVANNMCRPFILGVTAVAFGIAHGLAYVC